MGSDAPQSNAVPQVNQDSYDQASSAERWEKVRSIGESGERLAGIIKNRVRIPSYLNPGRYRIPDVLDKNGRIIGDVKNVNYRRLTNSFHDERTIMGRHSVAAWKARTGCQDE